MKLEIELPDHLYAAMQQYFDENQWEEGATISDVCADLIGEGLEKSSYQACEICGAIRPFSEMTYGVYEDLGWVCRPCAEEVQQEDAAFEERCCMPCRADGNTPTECTNEDCCHYDKDGA
jgi:hypothetical protein